MKKYISVIFLFFYSCPLFAPHSMYTIIKSYLQHICACCPVNHRHTNSPPVVSDKACGTLSALMYGQETFWSEKNILDGIPLTVKSTKDKNIYQSFQSTKRLANT